MLLPGRPTPGIPNIAACVNTQVHFLSQLTKVQTRINDMKVRHEPYYKGKQATQVGLRWPQAIRRRGEDGGKGWMLQLTKQKVFLLRLTCSRTTLPNGPFGDPKIL